MFFILSGKQVKLLLSHQAESPYISQNLIGPNAGNLTNTVITNVVPADFNGDVQMDLLLCRQKINDNIWTILCRNLLGKWTCC